MFWLVDMRLHFYFAAMDLFLGLGYSDYICTCQAKRHAQDQRNAGKVELECFVKACFIFIEIVKYQTDLYPDMCLSRRFEFNKSRDLCFAWSSSFVLDQTYTFIQKINPND